MTDRKLSDYNLMTVKELALYLRRPVSTLHQWRHYGRGPAWIKMGKLIVYDRNTVDRWLEGNSWNGPLDSDPHDERA